MKPPLPFARLASLVPPPGTRARLPLLLVPVLAGMAVVQLAWPERIALPPGGAVARLGPAALPAAPPLVVAPPLLASRDLFAPPARRAGSDGPSDPLAGAVIAGVVQHGRVRLGVVQLPGGHLRYVALGGAIAGWRLAALDQGEARLTRGGQSLHAPYGMHPLPSGNAGTPPAMRAGSPQTTESSQ